jgi:sugar phosphate isomerase/epimerase
LQISIRDGSLLSVYSTLEAGLQELGLKCAELTATQDLRFCDISAVGQIQLEPDKVQAYKEALHASGIKVTGVFVEAQFGAVHLEGAIDWVVSAVGIAEQLGAPIVTLGPWKYSDANQSLTDLVRFHSECVKRVLDATSECQVRLAGENQGIVGSNPQFLDMLLESVDSQRFGLSLDSANFYWAGNQLDVAEDLLKRFAPHAIHAHVNNVMYPPEHRWRGRAPAWEYERYECPVSDGDIDISGFVEALQTTGYSGALTIEDNSLRKYPSARRIQILKDDVLYLSGLIRVG